MAIVPVQYPKSGFSFWEGVSTVYDRISQALRSCWDSIVSWAQASYSATHFFASSLIEQVFGLSLANLYLKCVSFFHEWRGERREAELRAEIEKLLAEREELYKRVLETEPIRNCLELEIQNLRVEVEHLTNQRTGLENRLDQARSNLDVLQSTRERLADAQAEVVAVFSDRDAQIAPLLEQIQGLTMERNALRRQIQLGSQPVNRPPNFLTGPQQLAMLRNQLGLN